VRPRLLGGGGWFVTGLTFDEIAEQIFRRLERGAIEVEVRIR
jgi:hypothetical protein